MPKEEMITELMKRLRSYAGSSSVLEMANKAQRYEKIKLSVTTEEALIWFEEWLPTLFEVDLNSFLKRSNAWGTFNPFPGHGDR